MPPEDRFPPHRDARYFTPDGYRTILERALDLGYAVVPFRGFSAIRGQSILLLRHDLDHTFHFVQETAELESRLGVNATYFVQTAAEFYNLLSREGRTLVRRLVELGHEIGLHYESDRYVGGAGASTLRSDIRLLEDLSGQQIVSAAQHLPSDQDPVDVLEYVEHEAYEPRFTEAPMTYVSDSLMTWRQASPHDLLDGGVSFQFLTHPETWAADYASMHEALSAIREREADAVRQRYDATIDFYARLLDERAERDAAFRQKHARRRSRSS